MNSLMLLDWMGDVVSQILVQCQLWCWLGGITVVTAGFIYIGVAMFELLETLDRNDIGATFRH